MKGNSDGLRRGAGLKPPHSKSKALRAKVQSVRASPFQADGFSLGHSAQLGGSAYELMSQILVAQALLYIDEAIKNELIQHCRKIISELNSLIKTLEKG